MQRYPLLGVLSSDLFGVAPRIFGRTGPRGNTRTSAKVTHLTSPGSVRYVNEIWQRKFKQLNRYTDQIESANCFKLGFNPDGTWSSVPAEKCFDTRNQPTDCFCKRPV